MNKKIWRRLAVTLTLAVSLIIALPEAGYDVKAAQTGTGITKDFIRGVDISSIIAFEQMGQKFYYSNGIQGDIFDILKKAGVNYIRVRVWNDPYDTQTQKGYGGGNNDISKAVAIGQRAKAHGMKLLVDFHYSDFWADPAKQYAPKAWKNYTPAQKANAVYDFTYNSLSTLLTSGVEVGMVQIGNETMGTMAGMGGLYDGVWNLTSGVGAAMQKGCEAVNAANSRYGLKGEKAILKVLHFTDPNTTASWYAEQAAARGIDYDVFAVSAYPFWHGSPDDLAVTLKNIAKTYNKKVMVAETAYPYTFANADSTKNNVGSQRDMSYSGYDVSIAGQKKAIYDVFLAVAFVNTQAGTEGRGLGGFYWEPAWIGTDTVSSGLYGTGFATSVSGNYELLFHNSVIEYSTEDKGSSWDNMAMFDSDGKALDSLQVFNLLKNASSNNS
ncbi:glycoside hydrolase family 53 protein [Clostridium sp. Marseille-P2415]|uniref:glycoside hydrolase family 53 protein n=1 Tax=Clostridium sp. Marseille-P2415 TaxID=1805471 RepID=UPI0009887EC8|nr:glycosyl hydrolase 53 family protein [Clostridium sp. Marseille-P2415]